MLALWLAEGYSQRRAANTVSGQLFCQKRVAGRALAPGGRARGSYLRRKAVRDCDQSLSCGAGRSQHQAPPSHIETPSDHSDRWADASGVETRTLPKQKASQALCKRAAPRRAERSNHAPARRGRGSNQANHA